ncbi:MAG: hypothetical protein KJ935_06480 [Candidatus Omnitrophica bacterium]|nr:hypothetical protein [Candidatus Omnitrophota bacterium]
MSGKFKKVKTEFIRNILSIYKPEYILIQEAFYSPRQVEGRFSNYVYPFTPEPLFKYLNGTMLMFMLGQLTYVLIGLVIDKGHSPVVESLNLEDFRNIRDTTQAYFIGLDIKFKQRVPNKDGIKIYMKLVSERKRNNVIFAKIRFDIEGKIYGYIDNAMVINNHNGISNQYKRAYDEDNRITSF